MRFALEADAAMITNHDEEGDGMTTWQIVQVVAFLVLFVPAAVALYLVHAEGKRRKGSRK